MNFLIIGTLLREILFCFVIAFVGGLLGGVVCFLHKDKVLSLLTDVWSFIIGKEGSEVSLLCTNLLDVFYIQVYLCLLVSLISFFFLGMFITYVYMLPSLFKEAVLKLNALGGLVVFVWLFYVISMPLLLGYVSSFLLDTLDLQGMGAGYLVLELSLYSFSVLAINIFLFSFVFAGIIICLYFMLMNLNNIFFIRLSYMCLIFILVTLLFPPDFLLHAIIYCFSMFLVESIILFKCLFGKVA